MNVKIIVIVKCNKSVHTNATMKKSIWYEWMIQPNIKIDVRTGGTDHWPGLYADDVW